MKRCAVVIGVNKTGYMPILKSGVSGAREFHKWAELQGIESKLIVDDDSAPVTVTQILDTVKTFVDDGNYKQIIIYFSGHGIIKTADDEQWLLSEAPTKSNETVNLTRSIYMARKSAIPHVIFISDACRSRPENSLVNEVLGQAIFPNIAQGNTETIVDLFYATQPGDPSFEVKESEAVSEFKGVYTTCMLEGLHGKVPSIVQSITHRKAKLEVVPAYELGEYLKKAVPEALAKINIAKKQKPHSQVLSRVPLHLAVIPKKIEARGSNNLEIKRPSTIDILLIDDIHAEVRKNAIEKVTIPVEIQEPFEEGSQYITQVNNFLDANQEAKYQYEKLLLPTGNMEFSVNTGFKIIGDQKAIVLNQRITSDIEIKHGITYITIARKNERSSTLFIMLQNGNLVPLAILKGFIGVVIFEKGVLLNVNYVPSVDSPRFDIFRANLPELVQRRALVATAARHGMFKISGDESYILSQASYIRFQKTLDPTLGMYASYAYAQVGDFEDVSSVYAYMRAEPEPVLFDVAILHSLNPRAASEQFKSDFFVPRRFPRKHYKYSNPEKRTAPFCPILTQGWSYLPISNHPGVNNRLVNLGKYVVPGLWTTFNRKGADIIISRLKL